MRNVQRLGLLLWRGGLLLSAATVFFEAARWILRFIDIPAQLEIGFGLMVGGLFLVTISLIVERVGDRQSEGDLQY